jgi:drug/metabolite transporter (DMT)-like permease
MLVAASVMWSLSGVAVKLVQPMDPIAFAFWRSAAAAAGMALVIPFGTGRLPRAGWLVLSVALYTIVVTLLITAMTRSTAAAGILLQYTGPVWCAVLAWLFQRRTIGPRTGVALAIAVVGILVMVAGGAKDPFVLGIGLLSGVAFGGLILVLEHIESAGGVNTFAVILLNNLGCAAILLPIGLSGGTLAGPAHKMAVVWATGVVQLAIPYVLFQLALRRVEPVDASLLILLEPVLNPVWVWLVVGERPDVATFVGGAAILLAMIIEASKQTQRVVATGEAP